MHQTPYRLASFFENKAVFVTGHTGFIGSWLTIWLNRMASRVSGLALAPPTSPSLFESADLAARINTHAIADVRDYASVLVALQNARPDIVIHLAAQPLVRQSYCSPRETFDINITGTVNLLEAVRQVPSVKACVIVTSDKCYVNREWPWAYRETDRLGGQDPYSASKACVELVVDAYRSSFFKKAGTEDRVLGLGSVRAGNVFGGGDWAPDRVVPDCVRALSTRQPIKIRKPEAMRPWQHVLELASGCLWLAVNLWQEPQRFSSAWNFGPASEDWYSVRDLVKMVVAEWGNGAWLDASEPSPAHEAGLLRLSIDRAQTLLHWMPVWKLQTAVQRTTAWYKFFLTAPSASHIIRACETDIERYTADAREKETRWAQSPA
jgi:CDP-glucose 4,6-dehydratase